MDIRAVLRVLGVLLIFVGASLIFPIAISLFYKDGDFTALLASFLITMTAGGLLWKFTPSDRELKTREGFAVVTFGWIFLAVSCMWRGGV